jgi:ferrous-iron efflux pump FieF
MAHAHHHGFGHTHSHSDVSHITPANQRLMRIATYASVSMAVALLAGKTFAWWISDSMAMFSSLTDSLFDVVTSIINMIALRYALKPADDDHRFGHTSIEDIAGLAQFAFINAAMIIIVIQSVERLFNPQPLHHETIGIIVSSIAMVFTTVLVLFQSMVTKRTGSLIIASDRMHYVGDILFNLGVLVALFLSIHYGFSWADPAMAILIAAVVLWTTRDIGIRAFNNLMDREMPDSEKEKIAAIVSANPGIRNVHKLKTRYSGTKPFIQMHAEVDGALSFREAHDLIDRLEHALEDAFPGAEIIIHPDPIESM